MRRWLGHGAVWLVAALVCVLPGAARAQWETPTRQQYDAAKRLAPQQFKLTPAVARGGEARPIRLRIYADRDYRGTVLHWQAKARAQVERVNTVVRAVFNVRFEVESLRDWNRSHVGVPLGAPLLDELEDLDDGREVDLVIGLVTPLQGVASSVHAVGWARYLSRHFLLRGMDDEQEFRAFEKDLKLVSTDERQHLYVERKAHKEIVCFLHEWGHTLGLIHHEERRLIMNATYDPQQTEFSDLDRRILALVIERRLAARNELNPESADLLPLVEGMPASEGSEADRAMVLNLVRQRAKGGATAGADSAVDLSAADVAAFNRAVEALNAGRPDAAWKTLAPVVAHAHERKGGQVAKTTWLRLADLAAATGALTEADDAAGRAGPSPEAAKVAGKIESTRHRIALPLDAAKLGVPPDREPAYVAAYWETAKALDGTDAAAARARLGELAAAFPGTPGVEVLTCDVEMQARHLAAATKHCEAALEKFKGATRAHILLGVMAFASRRGPVGEQHLRTAIRLDPADPTAWRALAQFYRNTRASRQLTALQNEHEQLLSSPLPE